MKQFVKNYTFSVSAKTVTLTDFGTIRLDRLQLIVDTTTNNILYNFADSTIATATVATNIVTLSAVPGGSANGDSLMIVYDSLGADPVYDGGQRTLANSHPMAPASDSNMETTTGTTSDAAVVSDANGTISAKLRGIVKIFADIWDSTNHFFKVSQATLIAGEDQTNNVMKVEQQFTYANIATSTTTTVKSGAGFLHAISVNTKGTVASTIVVYDNTAGSGTKIGTIDSLNLYGIFILDVKFNTGLTIVTTGTIAPDLTVSYR